ncbi:MAG: hypothetical protein R2788_10385 [Saprospiraceae bacterium]
MNKFLSLFFFVLASRLLGQSVEHYEKLALASFYSKDFPTSLLYSEKIIQLDKEHIASLFFAGESARLMNDLSKAEAYLEQIPDDAKAGFLAATDYHLGLVKQGLEKRDEAKDYYERYLNNHYNEKDIYSILATNAIHSLATGDDWIEQGSYLDKLPGNINTENADMAPLRYADKLFYSSVLEDNYLPTKNKKKKKKMVKRPVSRIYEAQFNKEARESSVNPRSAILNASNISLMPDASRMYYTLCADENPTSQEQCTIWYRNRFYDGEWGPGIKLPEQINTRNYTNTQPSVAYDWTLKKYVLYFVSNRPGGKGGKDIWCSEIGSDDSFGEPYPIPLNTERDEITPFFHQSTQTLFFSSEGWESKGGFDIFHAKKNARDDWQAPVNMGPYLNTKGDEFYYSYHTSSKFAYFVSGKMSRGVVESDIFEARVFVDFQLRVFDNQTKSPIHNVSVEIENTQTGAKGKYTTGDDSHDAKIKLEPSTKYRITIDARGFQPQTLELSTEDISYFLLMEKNIFLKPYARP